MSFIKKNYKYLFVFLFVFLCILFFGWNNTDNIWNYGMAHAIRIGEIPYKDFNIITTPLYAFYMSFFLLFYDHYITFLLAQSLLVTICYYFIDKMIGKKSMLLFPAAGFGLFYLFFPNYNFLVFTFIVLLMYLEKENKSDYLIGFILGLLILTKHTMGAVIVFFSFISTFNLSKCFKRLLGMIPVGIVFLLYLFITGSFSSFWNLSIMGLLDFGGHNHYRSYLIMFLCLLVLVYAIYSLKVNKKDSMIYYLVGSLFFAFPLADLFHFQYIFALFLICLLYSFDDFSKLMVFASVFLSVFFVMFNIYNNWIVYQNISFVSFPHFNGYLLESGYARRLKIVADDYQKRDNAYMFAISNMFFDIATNHKITYMDIPLYGNFGYDGVNTMKKKIDEMHDVYFYVSGDTNIQYCDEVYEYIREVGEFSYMIENFEVFYKE